MIPAWLQRHLEQTDRWDADGIRRAASNSRCRDCRAPILTGLDADRVALVARCDPQPVSPIGEVIALATGRPTYNLSYTAGRLQIDHRDQWRIASRHRDRGHVLAEHRCHSPLPTDTDQTEQPTPTLAAFVTDDGPLPF